MTMKTVSAILLIVIHCSNRIRGECPPNSFFEPCVCIPNIPFDLFQSHLQLRPQITNNYQKSILCEHIDDSSFDLRSIFMKYSLLLNNNQTQFDGFFLHQTRIHHLPENIFGNVTFSGVVLHENPLLTSIDPNAFTNIQDSLEVFQTLNTNLSETSGIFDILKKLTKLRMISMHNDQLQSIPDYAFNHAELTDIWLGLEMGETSQPIKHIGQYPFYNLPKLRTIRIFSPFLNRIGKYAFAQRNRSTIGNDDLNRMLYISIGSPMIDANSFEITSFTRFRSRPVFLRFYNTSITYLNESVFQPFLETHPASLLDVKYSNISETCDCQSEWIYRDYCRGWQDSRVYGTSCCSPQFTQNCTSSIDL